MKILARLTSMLILLSLTIAGCVEYIPEHADGNTTLITASCPQAKTVNDGLATEWQTSDKLSVFVEEAGGFFNIKFSYVEEDTFSGELPGLSGNQILYAVYPYTSRWSSPESVNINVAGTQSQSGNDSMAQLAGPGFPLYGKSTCSAPLSFTMNQLLSVGRFNIKNGCDKPISVNSIEFTTSVPVAGEFVVDLTGVSPVYVPVQGKSYNGVTLSVNNGNEIASGETASFYAGFAPFSTTGNFSIRVAADINGTEVYSSKEITDKQIELTAGAITGLNYTFTLPDENLSEDYIGSFNLVNTDMDSFMIEAEKQYTDSNWRDPDWKTPGNKAGLSIVTNYPLGDNGDLSDDPTLVAYSNDRPNPVVIPVEGHNGQPVTVTVSGDGEYADYEYITTSTVSDSKICIYNLIPNRRYHYSVICSGSEISKGYFDTEGRRRIIKVSDVVSADNANNFRDFGGLKTVDGKTMAYGKLFRGTNMDGLSTVEKAYMTDVLNIGLDVDLRREEDTGRNQAKRILDSSKANYSNAGFASFNDLITPGKMKTTVLDILETLQAGKAVYIHCFAGADRTGCVSMLLEALCGVSEKDCTIDYELTSFSCIGARPRTAFNSGFLGWFHPYLLGLEGDSFKKQAERFLLDCGLSAEQISALQSTLTSGSQNLKTSGQ